MRDADGDVLAQDLQAALRADAAATSVPPVSEVLSRSRRRRAQRSAGAVMAVVLVVTGGVAGTALLDGDGASTSYVTPLEQERVLDSGTDANGPWRVVSSLDGYCIRRIHATGSGGSCGQAEPEKLTEGSIFSVEDEGEPFTIAAGPTPDATAEVVIALEDGSVHRTSPVRHGERTVYVLRLPGHVTLTAIEARSATGELLDRHSGFPSEPPDLPTGPTPGQAAQTLVDQFRAFAADPSPSLLAETPISPQVQLGLGTEIVKTVPSHELVASADSWVLPVDTYDGWAVGPFSALDELADPRPVEVNVGSHPHCASPPRPAPEGLEAAQRFSAQPATIDSCLSWYTVDFFLVDGLVAAVTVDYYEP